MKPHQFDTELEILRFRARAGDPHAVRELEARLSPAIRRIVRRVLRLNRADTPLERGILRVAARHAALGSDTAPVRGHALVGAVAQRLWEVIASPAEPPQRPAGSAAATSRWAAETDFA